MKFIKNFTVKYPRLAEIVRFLIVGGLATIIDMFFMGVVLYCFEPALYPYFYNVFIGGGNPSTLATIVGTGVGFVSGLIFNYVFSIVFVFHEKGKSKSVTGFVLFTILSLGGLLIHILGMYVGYDLMHWNEWIIKIILTFVVLVYNYITRKVFVFSKKETPKEHTSNE